MDAIMDGIQHSIAFAFKFAVIALFLKE